MGKTVFFGPFVGEFGWEILYWHGWVRKMCRTTYKSYHKIACSFPGHHLFYPEVDEFIPLPNKLVKKKIPSRSLITDCWINGFPHPHGACSSNNFYNLTKRAIADIKKRLPKNTEFIFPWDVKQGDVFYGIKFPQNPNSDEDFKTYRIPPSEQYFEKLEASKRGNNLLAKLVDKNQKLITIFPRYRKTRRPDKNWGKENYKRLIRMLQKEFPDLKIALIGIPHLAYFSDGVPKGCIDLINVKEDYRMDYEVAALDQSILTIGSISGTTIFALICGCPSLTWSHGAAYKNHKKNENPLKTYLLFYPCMHPTADEMFKYAKWILEGKRFFKRPWLLESKKMIKLISVIMTPEFIMRSKSLAKIKKMVF